MVWSLGMFPAIALFAVRHLAVLTEDITAGFKHISNFPSTASSMAVEMIVKMSA